MSYQRGWQALNLEMPDKIPHTEYIFHKPFTIKVTGLGPDFSEEDRGTQAALANALDYDLFWSVYERDWGLPQTDMGRAKYYEEEVPHHSHYPFKSVEEVLSFDPLAAARVPSQEQLTEKVRSYYEEGQAEFPEAVFTGGFYNSVFTWNIRTFGWELFMAAAMEDPVRFDRILEGFWELSNLVVQAHVRAEVPVFICHDDIAWASGPVFAPQWMRRYIFPRLKRLWAPLREAGIKVLFCSDGNIDVFVDDLVAAGAQGFFLEPLSDMARLVRDYGQTHVIVGNIDTRILQFYGPEEIRAEVKRCADLGRHCPGYFFAVGNHIPYTVPIDSIECYLEAIAEFGRR